MEKIYLAESTSRKPDINPTNIKANPIDGHKAPYNNNNNKNHKNSHPEPTPFISSCTLLFIFDN